MTVKLCSEGLAGRAVCERDMVIGNVVKKVDLFFLQHQAGGNRVDGSIAPAFVKETAILVESLKIVEVCLRAQPVQVTDFKVRPL